MHRAALLTKPLSVRAGLRLVNNAEPALRLPDETEVLETIAKAISAELVVDQNLTDRLFKLWNGLVAVDGDELVDWGLEATVKLAGDDEEAGAIASNNLVLVTGYGDLLRLGVIGIGATVYLSGEVAFSITLEGLHAPLWFDELLDLSQLSA